MGMKLKYFFVGLLVIGLLVTNAHAQTIRLTIGISPKTPLGQYFDEMLSEAFSQLGYDFELHYVQNKRASQLVNLGYFDGEAIRVREYGAHYPLLTRVNFSHTDLVFAAYSGSDKFKISSWESLKQQGETVAYRRGAVRPRNMLSTHFPNDKIYDVATSHIGLKLVADRSIDFFIGVKSATRAALADIPKLKTKTYEVGVVERIPGYMYLHQEHAGLVPQLEHVLREMKGRGLIDKYYQEIYEAAYKP